MLLSCMCSFSTTLELERTERNVGVSSALIPSEEMESYGTVSMPLPAGYVVNGL